MVGIGFCTECDVTVFANEVEGKDYVIFRHRFFCKDCWRKEKRHIAEMAMYKQVIERMERMLSYYEFLAKYTKQSVKLREHLSNIRFIEESIEDYKREKGLE